MDTIFLTSNDPTRQTCDSILSWSTDFTDLIISSLENHGWRASISIEKSAVLHCGPNWKILVEKGTPYHYSIGGELWNPKYTILCYNLVVGEVDVRVHRSSTCYIVHWNEEAFERIKIYNNLVLPNISRIAFPLFKNLSLFLIGE